MWLTEWLAHLGEALGRADKIDDGLRALDEGLGLAGSTGERCYEAELRRIKGQLLRQKGQELEAEASLQQALEVARAQGSKGWELRAAMSLGRLWQRQGRTGDARELVRAAYGWFTEGFDTADLREAKALLDALA